MGKTHGLNAPLLGHYSALAAVLIAFCGCGTAWPHHQLASPSSTTLSRSAPGLAHRQPLDQRPQGHRLSLHDVVVATVELRSARLVGDDRQIGDKQCVVAGRRIAARGRRCHVRSWFLFSTTARGCAWCRPRALKGVVDRVDLADARPFALEGEADAAPVARSRSRDRTIAPGDRAGCSADSRPREISNTEADGIQCDDGGGKGGALPPWIRLPASTLRSEMRPAIGARTSAIRD